MYTDRLSPFYSSAELFWQMALAATLSGILFSVAFFGSWELLIRLRRWLLGGRQ